MSTPLSDEIKDELFTQIKHRLGAPIRKIELDWDQMCSLLATGIEDYAQRVQDWLIENQWSSVLGESASKSDIAFAITTRSLDFEDSFSYAYSKAVGLQTRGPWEMKKDYVTIETNQQVYEIPAGREINEVLWFTPNSTDHALYSFAGMGDMGFGGGYGQVPFGGYGSGGNLGNGGFYVAPAYDIMLRAQDFSLKSKLLRSELTFKVTAGPNGTRLLHLMPIPGARMNFGVGGGINGRSIGLAGTKVWYNYYDTGDMTDEERENCLNENKDIIKLPNDVPLSKLTYGDLNEPTRVWVRRYLTALFKESLGRVRGKFSGDLKVPDAELKMDYESLLSEGKEEQTKLLEDLDNRLERLSNKEQLERKASEAESLNKVQGYKPLGIFVI
jgi:hypothetical protein|tara:strand:- start:772 stop:1929 length:1158 start_codon:yes stop_codon:yes gene_type:complete